MKRLAAIALVLPLLVTCAQLGGSGGAGSASFVVGLSPTAGTKTLVPDFSLALDSFDVRLVSRDGFAELSASVEGAAGKATLIAPAGFWDVLVTASKGGQQVATGRVDNVELKAEETKAVTVSLVFPQTASTGTGGISLELRFPANLGIDYALGEIAGQSLTPAIVQAQGATGQSSATFAASGITSGNGSDLVITLKKGGAGGLVAGVFREAVNVWDDLTSDHWVDGSGQLASFRLLDASELFDANASLSGLAVSDATFPSSSPFASSETTYPYSTDNLSAIRVPAARASITATESVQGQKISYSTDGTTWTELQSGVGSVPVALDDSILTVYVKVTPLGPGYPAKTYTLKLVRTYKVTYDGLGSSSGAVPVDGAQYASGDSLTVAANSGDLARSGYAFSGWSTKPDGLGTPYPAGTTVPMPSGGLVLYPIWSGPGMGRVWFELSSTAKTIRFPEGYLIARSGNQYNISPADPSVVGSSTDWRWYVDGILVPGSTSTFSWTAGQAGDHVLSVSALYMGASCSGSFKVRVTDAPAGQYAVVYSNRGADSGEAPVDPNYYATGASVGVIASCGTMSRQGCNFAGWVTGLSGPATSYGTTSTPNITIGNTDAVLYPVWIPSNINFVSSGNSIALTGQTGPSVGALVIPQGVTGIKVATNPSDGNLASASMTSISIPATIKAWDSYAFNPSVNVSSINLAEGLDFVGPGAFVGMNKVKSVSLPTSLTRIAAEAFNTTGLTSVSLPPSLAVIETEAFGGTPLTNLQLPASVTSIGTIIDCFQLASITVAPSSTSFESIDGVLYSKDGKTLVRAPTMLAGSFSPPEGVLTIAQRAFQQCSAITTLTLPASLKTISYCAFAQMSGLRSISIPESVTYIDSAALYNCANLGSVILSSAVPPTLGAGTNHFQNHATPFNIYVPQAALSDYSSAPVLSSYASSMVGLGVQTAGPAGGYVFYDKGSYSNGWRYLEAAPTDQSAGAQWTPANYSVATTSVSTPVMGLGAGDVNTSAIIAAAGDSGTYAAKLCADLVLGGYSDWYLPTDLELYWMNINLHVNGLGGFANGQFYWSSEYGWYDGGTSQHVAYNHQFTVGGLNNGSYETQSFYVRAVRCF